MSSTTGPGGRQWSVLLSVAVEQLPMVAVCFDARGRVLASSSSAAEFLQRWPDLMDRFVAAAVAGTGKGGDPIISRGGMSWRIEVIPAALESREARLVLALYTPPQGGSQPEGALASLTRRQRQVAALASSGQRTLAIAALLGCTERTVRAHLQEVYRKLGVGSRAELASIWPNL